MAGKITDASALTGANVATGDQLELVDVSDTSLAATGTNKKITADELAIALGTTLGLVGRDKIWDTKGDLAVATGADAASKLAVGANDLVLTPNSAQSTGLQWTPRTPPSATLLPTGALAATFDRAIPASAATLFTSGTLALFEITLSAGQLIANISMKSGGTAASSPTHWWFGLFDINRVALAFTADQTTTAWGTFTVKTVSLSAAFTILTTGEYYLGAMMTATTPCNIFCATGLNTNITNIPPIMCGNTTDTGLTTVPALPFTAGAITAGTVPPYAWVA